MNSKHKITSMNYHKIVLNERDTNFTTNIMNFNGSNYESKANKLPEIASYILSSYMIEEAEDDQRHCN